MICMPICSLFPYNPPLDIFVLSYYLMVRPLIFQKCTAHVFGCYHTDRNNPSEPRRL